jgi:hypothetical protein
MGERGDHQVNITKSGNVFVPSGLQRPDPNGPPASLALHAAEVRPGARRRELVDPRLLHSGFELVGLSGPVGEGLTQEVLGFVEAAAGLVALGRRPEVGLGRQAGAEPTGDGEAEGIGRGSEVGPAARDPVPRRAAREERRFVCTGRLSRRTRGRREG